MRNALAIGRIFGIEVQLDYSWFIIFVLVAWSLAVGYFPQGYPDWPVALYWGLGLATSLLFFGSVLAHELAHSLVARRSGTPVRNIRLFIFGGVAQITEEPKSARDEFRFTIAGPLTSLAIGLCFGAIWWATRRQNSPVTALAQWLSFVNFMLAGFNMIPGFPLDGGRVFRSIVWAITKDLRRATQLAAMIGRTVAFLFILAGVLLVFRGYLINGLWLAFIGWFLENAANQSWRQFTLQELLQGHTVSEVLTTDWPQVSPDLPLDRLVEEHVLTSLRRCLPVIEDGRLKGVITVHNLREVPRADWSRTPVAQVMIPFDRVRTIAPEAELLTALQLMTREDINQLPVVTDQSLVGMLARDKILAFIRTRAELGL
ncbi:MAG: site-2 protease family protein [Candidatus Acetothermia bacterium]|jgi:Zn-dependent protease/CBS domain-containing protein|nr:site-2 protease family protein [Candidatus Acetothermia bacterium]MDH7505145.1 site-2 protease family protein [Candidatus Acetothermia bacterium]